MRECKALAISVLIVLALATAGMAGERLEIPRGMFYYQPASSVFGSEALWTNPAGVGWYNAGGVQAMASFVDGDFGDSWGIVTSGQSIASAYRALDNPGGQDYKEYIFAYGTEFYHGSYLGISYRYFKDGPSPYKRRHLWNIGYMDRWGSKLRYAIVLSNLNRGRIDGERTRVEQRYSLSYRLGEWPLTLSADMMITKGMSIRDADFVYHAEVNPTRGLYLNGFVDSDRNFQVGVRANLLDYFVGNRSNFSRHGDHRGSTVFAGYSLVRQPSLIPYPKRRLALSLSGRLQENPTRPLIGHRRQSFVTMVLDIYRAAEDASIAEMVISLDRFYLGFAQAQELRGAIEYFRSQGKRVVCHLSTPGNISYYVAAAADAVLIPPVSQLRLVGLRAELTFWAGTLEKLGIEADLMRIGDYKTAAETYTREEATEENRQQIERILDDLYYQFVAGIATSRQLTADSVRKIIDAGPYTSTEALSLGLVDGLSYRDELDRSVLPRMPQVSYRQYRTDTLQNNSWKHAPVLALVVAEGDVAERTSGLSPLSGSTDVTPSVMQRAFASALSHRDVAGIVLRVNSPGGLALAGDKIHHQVDKAAQEKPLVVSMSNVAASGGYYITAPASWVFALSGTVTGSIGIYGGKVNLSGLYEKIDLNKELYTRGTYAGIFSTARPFTQEERTKYFSQMSAFYDHFVSLVANGRGLSRDSVDSIARGRVWTGREALRNGLVNQMGGIKQALDYTAQRLGLESYRVSMFPVKRTLIEFPGGSLFRTVAGLFESSSDLTETLTAGFGGEFSEGIIARLPYDIDIR